MRDILSEEELNFRLKPLDRKSEIWFALRCALRVLPNMVY
jgi:hypothetical protein